MTDEELERILDVPFVFWTCPRGHRGGVRWNDARTEATCEACGLKSTDPEAIELAAAELQRFRERRDDLC